MNPPPPPPPPPPPKKYTDYIYGPPAITNKWCTGTVLYNCKLGVLRCEKPSVSLSLVTVGPSAQTLNEQKCQMTHHKIPS